uniref:Uncharacterized protein n=1 Tax=Aegilops tauschii subsp. strangulata TaxID=200361 RepID=A0A452Y9S6_AEGTS
MDSHLNWVLHLISFYSHRPSYRWPPAIPTPSPVLLDIPYDTWPIESYLGFLGYCGNWTLRPHLEWRWKKKNSGHKVFRPAHERRHGRTNVPILFFFTVATWLHSAPLDQYIRGPFIPGCTHTSTRTVRHTRPLTALTN